MLKFDHRGRETSKSYKSASTSKASKTSKTTRGEEQISKTPNVFGTDISDLNTNNNRQQYYFNTAPIYNYSQNVYFENEKNQVTDKQKLTKAILFMVYSRLSLYSFGHRLQTIGCLIRRLLQKRPIRRLAFFTTNRRRRQ